jgi:hypothetical protein
VRDTGQEQQVFLDVGGEVGEVQDLSHAEYACKVRTIGGVLSPKSSKLWSQRGRSGSGGGGSDIRGSHGYLAVRL